MLTKEQFIEQANAHDAAGNRCLDFANQVLPFIYPKRKPLRELANNEEDCRKVFEYFFPHSEYEETIKYYDYIDIRGRNGNGFANLEVNFVGNIEISFNEEISRVDNIFMLVDFIRSLGFEPTKD